VGTDCAGRAAGFEVGGEQSRKARTWVFGPDEDHALLNHPREVCALSVSGVEVCMTCLRSNHPLCSCWTEDQSQSHP
jgi:hypothetical protein